MKRSHARCFRSALLPLAIVACGTPPVTPAARPTNKTQGVGQLRHDKVGELKPAEAGELSSETKGGNR